MEAVCEERERGRHINSKRRRFDNRNLKKMKTSLQKVRIYGRYA